LDEARDHLNLDWRRYLDLILTFTVPPTASAAQAIHIYQQALHADQKVPRPLPYYMDERSSKGLLKQLEGFSTTASDLHFELMKLWAQQQQQQQRGRQGQGHLLLPYETLHGLLQASAYSPNPMDGGMAWHVMTVLQV
jgi:hypothetical protein